jgi:hypothetical protein
MKITLPDPAWRYLLGSDLSDLLRVPSVDPVRMFLDQIRHDAESAVKKTEVADLTEGEKFALAYYARVPFQPQCFDPDGDEPYKYTMTTVPCGFYHNGEKWIVTMRAEDGR